MAQKNEQLSAEIVDKLRKLQSDSNDVIYELGQIEVRFLDLKTYKKSLEENFTKNKILLDEVLKDLEAKYPNGEVNLQDGTVSFEE
jgi:hypothetical protein